MTDTCPLCGAPAPVDAGGDVHDAAGKRARLCVAHAYGCARPAKTQPEQPIIVTVLAEIGRNVAAGKETK